MEELNLLSSALGSGYEQLWGIPQFWCTCGHCKVISMGTQAFLKRVSFNGYVASSWFPSYYYPLFDPFGCGLTTSFDPQYISTVPLLKLFLLARVWIYSLWPLKTKLVVNVVLFMRGDLYQAHLNWYQMRQPVCIFRANLKLKENKSTSDHASVM